MSLPPGQYESKTLPRFGLWKFAERFPKEAAAARVTIGGDVNSPLALGDALLALPRTELVADFHCVTTWSCTALSWSGFRFADFYARVVEPQAGPNPGADFVVMRGQDGYHTSLPLEDLLAGDVLLADRLGARPLGVEHGAPLRVVAPAHYGYKSVKHLCAVDFWMSDSSPRRSWRQFMDHPRARVAAEERGRGLPGWCFRYLYRPLVGPTIRRFSRAAAATPGQAGKERA